VRSTAALFLARHTFVCWADLLALNTDFDDLGLFVKIMKSSTMWTNIISIWVVPKSGDRTNSSTSLSRLQWLQFRLYLCVRLSTSWCLKFISCICRSSIRLLMSYLTCWSLQFPCCLSPSQPCIYLNFPCIYKQMLLIQMVMLFIKHQNHIIAYDRYHFPYMMEWI